MLILGKNKDDKGTQLEKLVSAVLSKKGYVNVVTNKIGSGGEELDVTAEYVVPLMGATCSKRFIAECKAHKNPVDVPTWLKFLGKIFTDEVRTGQKVSGCLIALSGVNGNCQGAYDDLKLRRDDITVLAGDALQALLAELYQIAKAAQIEKTVRALTDKPILLMDMVYYENAVYWVIKLDGGIFALLDSSGKALEKPKGKKLAALLKKAEAFGKHIDLQEEAEARNTAMKAKKHLIMKVILGNGETGLDAIKAENNYSPDVIDTAAQALVDLSIAQVKEGKLVIADGETVVDYMHIIAMFKELFDKFTLLEPLGKPFYDRHINERFLDHILKIQADLVLTPDQRGKAIKLLRLSPAGMTLCLKPIDVIVNHRKMKAVDPRIIKTDQDIFFQLMHKCLRDDFMHPLLREYFHEVRGEVELDTEYRIRLKSNQAVTFEDVARERHMIGPLADHLTSEGQKYVLMLSMNDGPEPWEQDEWIKKRQEEMHQASDKAAGKDV